VRESPINLLVVDDEPAMRRVVRTSLLAIGYAIEEAASGEAALQALGRRPDMVLLDINMPGIGGIETCRRIRQMAPNIGIVMISVRDREDDKVQALEAGADDYVTKPFRLRELLARLRAVRRRTGGDNSTQPAILRAGDLELDVTNRMFRKAGREVHLSQKEFDILAFLMKRPDTPIPHARLLQAVWGPEYGGETEYLRTYVRHLRKKIERDAARPEYILTEPWVGYRFRDSRDSSPESELTPAA
jgi:two-component system, OmpR family, KDP operon response regulator KdpE